MFFGKIELPRVNEAPYRVTYHFPLLPTRAASRDALDGLLDQVRAMRKRIDQKSVPIVERVASLEVSLEGIEATLERLKGGQS